MDNRNVFVAIALSMSVLLFWGAFFDTPKQQKNVVSQKQERNLNSSTEKLPIDDFSRLKCSLSLLEKPHSEQDAT